ncbi:MAG: RNA polymerase subunit sigma-24 [Planctomycetota bacterium]|nr:MAG: RNA polymerase subunit sigma-24 [Planctomycetota bacterium]
MPPPETIPVADLALVLKARAGDRIAFTALMQRHAAKLNACLLAYVTPSDVDDLLQETMLAAWRGLPALQQTAEPLPWMFGIARNLGRRNYTKRSHQEISLSQPELLRARESDGISAAYLLRHIHQLPEAYRVSLALRLLEGFGSASIALATGMTEASVRVNLSRGMKILRENLGREGYP